MVILILKTIDLTEKSKKIILTLIYGSLVFYSIGLTTSISILSLSHIFILVPCLVLSFYTNWQSLPKSAYGLLAFVLAIYLSFIFNFDIMRVGFKPIFKTKYFLIGFLSIVPLFFILKTKISSTKIRTLIYLSIISTLIAVIAGAIGRHTGFNPILMKTVNVDRNSGLMGMVLNHAHNLSYFLTIYTCCLIIFWRNIKKNHKILLVSALIIFLFGLYTTYTRGAILAFIAGVIGFNLKSLKNLVLTSIVLAALGLTGYFANYKNFQREGSNVERLSMWKAALSAYQERPIFGWGYLNFEHHSLDIKKKYNYEALTFGGHAHNSILEVMASTGSVGFLAFLTWIGFWVRELFLRSDKWAKVELAALCAFFVGGLTQSTIGLGINLFFIMFVYSLSAANTMIQAELKNA